MDTATCVLAEFVHLPLLDLAISFNTAPPPLPHNYF